MILLRPLDRLLVRRLLQPLSAIWGQRIPLLCCLY